MEAKMEHPNTDEQNDDSEDDIWYVCKYCGRGYREAKKLIAHKRENHMPELIECKRQKDNKVGRVTYVYPPLCTQESTTKHTNVWTNGDFEDDPEDDYINDETNDDTFDVPIIVKVETQCTTVQSSYSAGKHERVRNGSPNTGSAPAKFSCELCMEEFQSISKLYEHQAVHSKKYPCSSCTLTFERLTILNAHVKSIHGEPGIGTPEISTPNQSYSTGNYAHLAKEDNVLVASSGVSSVPPFSNRTKTSSTSIQRKCPICAKVIPASSFRQHQIHHRRSSKELRCKVCPFTTRHQSSLFRHVKGTHTVQHEHQCTLCTASFQRLFNLSNHMVSVHKSALEATSQNSDFVKMTATSPNPDAILKKTATPKTKSESPTVPKSSHLKCSFCSKQSQNANLLRLHMRTHTGEKPYKCKHCPYRSAQRGTLSKHELDVHPAIRHKFKCSACSASYMQFSNFKKHFQTMHGSQQPQKNKGVSSFTAKKHLESKLDSAQSHPISGVTRKTREQYENKRSPTGTANVKLGAKQAMNRSMRTVVKCEQCPHRASNSWSLASHIESVHGDNDGSGKLVHQCKLCLSSFSRLKDLENHMSAEHPAEYSKNAALSPPNTSEPTMISDSHTMPILQKQLYAGNDHFALTGDTQSFVCNICKSKFVKKSDLEIHLRTHSTYFCKYCNYTSKKENHMTVHMQSIHKDETDDNMDEDEFENSNCEMPKLEAEIQPTDKFLSCAEFTCKICQRSFKTGKALESHSMAHAHEKPFACKICNSRYVRKGDLLRHRRIKNH